MVLPEMAPLTTEGHGLLASQHVQTLLQTRHGQVLQHRQIRQRLQNESARRQAGVRQHETWIGNGLVAIEKEVQVQRAGKGPNC
jgi:hypothetical protein